MYRKLYCLVGLLSILCTDTWAQADVAKMKSSFSPASPEAAALFKFQDIPVSKYTGTADVTVPIATVDGKNMSWPINLQYHTGGIKVSEMASFTGLGWKLNASGMVSRKVRGLPDDDPKGYLHAFNWWNTVYAALTSPDTYGNYFYDAVDAMTSGLTDGEPDEFYFSFNGYSGKLAFKQGIALQGRPPLTVSCNVPMKVEYELSGTSISAFKFFAPDGLKYTFDVIETTRSRPETPDFCNLYNNLNTPYNSSWYLSSISSNNGFNTANITFTYDSYGIDYGWITTETETHTRRRGFPNTNPDRNFSRSKSTLGGKKLKQIYFADTKTYVDFEYVTPRFDMSASGNNKALDYVIVSRLTGNGTDKKVVQKVQLEYFHQSNRLMLKSVQQIGTDEVTKTPPYQFTYDTRQLPDRIQGAMQIDHWGFGANGGGLPTWSSLHQEGWDYYGTEKEPSLYWSQAQSLLKIQYPTGGTSNFDYELNDYGFVQTDRIYDRGLYDKVDTMAGTSVIGEVGNTNYVMNETIVRVGGGRFVVQASLAPCFFDADSSILEPPPGTPIFCPNRNWPIVELYEYSSETGQGRLVNRMTLSQGIPGWDVQAQGGQYLLKVFAAGYNHPRGPGAMSVGAYFVWKTNTGERKSKLPAGGIRVKTITDYDSIGKIGKVRNFKYTGVYQGIEHSSGVIYAEPKYKYGFFSPISSNFGTTWDTTYNVTIAMNSIQTEETGGSHIGYRNVIEWETYKNKPNGKIVSQYTSPYEYQDVVERDKPFGIPYTQSFKTGLLLNESTYDSSNIKLKESKYEYVFKHDEMPAVKAGRGEYDCGCGRGIGDNSPCSVPSMGLDLTGDGYADMPNPRFSRSSHPARMGFSQIKKETHMQDGFTVQKNYEYDYNLQLVKKVEVKSNDSDPDSIVMTYKHPGDEGSMTGLTPDELAAITSLKNSNMVTVILEEKKRRKNTDIMRVRSHFKNFVSNSRTALSGVSIQNGTGTLDKKYDIDGYNEFGKIIQQRKANDYPMSYIWDDQVGSPTAEVSNATALEIAFTSFESNANLGSSGWTIGTGSTFTRATGTVLTGSYAYQLSNGNITRQFLPTGKKYIVSYWSKNGAYNVNGITPITGRTNGLGWTYYEHLTSNTTTTITVSGVGLIDELRLYPQGAEMTSFNYEPGVGLRSKNSPDNIIAFYEFDPLNRLKVIRDQDGNILQLTDYQYQTMERDVTPDWQDILPVETRCETTADLGHSYSKRTGYRVRKQIDKNHFSNTYNQIKWIRSGADPACPPEPHWIEMGMGECVRDNFLNYTGYYRIQEYDINPYSPTHGQYRLNPNQIPSPSGCSIPPPCTEEGYKRVNNNECIYGQRYYLPDVINGCERVRTYQYIWTYNGYTSRSGFYTTTVPIIPCNPGSSPFRVKEK